MKTASEKRLELLNSISENIVEYMNKSLLDQQMGVKGLYFETQELLFKEVQFLAYFDLGYTPAGEDYSENIVFFDGTLQGLSAGLEDLYESFDIDDHVSMWIEGRNAGVAGVPSAVDLVHDAEYIDKFLQALDKSFQGFEDTLSSKLQDTLSEPPAQKQNVR